MLFMEIQNGVNYNVNDLKRIFGNEWVNKINLKTYPILTKKKINTFNDFDFKTKQIYVIIYDTLKSINIDSFNFWATGSRVNGNWRTNDETEYYSKKLNLKIKYSDYDFYSDAKMIPNKEYFITKYNIDVDFIGVNGHKVLITDDEINSFKNETYSNDG